MIAIPNNGIAPSSQMLKCSRTNSGNLTESSSSNESKPPINNPAANKATYNAKEAACSALNNTGLEEDQQDQQDDNNNDYGSNIESFTNANAIALPNQNRNEIVQFD